MRPVLLLALGLMAFAGGIGIEYYRRAEIAARRVEQVQFNTEADIIKQAFVSHLQNPETCTRALYHQPIAPGRSVPVVMNYQYDPESNPGAKGTKSGDAVTKGLTAEVFEVSAPGPADMITRITEIRGSLRRHLAYLKVSLRSEAARAALSLPFYVWTDDQNRITSCFGINSAGAFCNFMRGYYHVAGPDEPGLPVDHSLACRQTVFTQITGYKIVRPANGIGTCRYHGIAPSGTCPPSGFVPHARFAETFQTPAFVSGRIYQGMDLCLQCE